MTVKPMPRIGFVLKTYPKLSETFILGEILGLEKLGLPLHILSLQRPTDAISHAAIASVQAAVSYVLAPSLGCALRLAYEQLCLAASSPRRYAQALLFAFSRAEEGGFAQLLQAGTLALAARRAGIEHLHAHFASEPAAVAELAHKLTGMSYSISAHAKDIYLSPPEVLAPKLAGASFTVTCTEYNRRHLASLAGAGTRVLRMYHGVDIDRFRPANVRPHSQPPLILSVGRLREKKGFATLIEACSCLVDQGVRFQCQIVGYGPDAAKLQAMIDERGLAPLVTLARKLTHEQLIERYQAASVFALPCQIAADGDRDGIPNVLLEAMATQLPIVSTPVSGIPEVVEHGISGLLVPPEEPSALAASIATLIADPDLRARLGRAGRALVAQRFSSDANLELLRDLLKSATEREVTAVASKVGERIYAR